MPGIFLLADLALGGEEREGDGDGEMDRGGVGGKGGAGREGGVQSVVATYKKAAEAR